MIHLASMLLAIAAPTPDRVTTFVGEDAKRLLAQCSRPAPSAGSSFFRPDSKAVEILERAVADRDGSLGSIRNLRRGWNVEAVGIVRNGRRHVYGSFVPKPFHEKARTPPIPTVICDGGPKLFGAEVELPGGRITHWAANGR